ncbi:MAG: hypothetical protein LBJ88_00990 [Campylobacteraceae bacterium]|jgi:cytochrome c553|nr:hypothetical protein [Campylobacteraceae bacterium]
MRIIKKAVKIFGIFVCGFIVFLMFYLALTQRGGSYEAENQNKIYPQNKNEEEKILGFENNIIDLNSKPTSRLYASKCSACHGKNGGGRFDDKGEIIFPSIAAKSHEFILQRVYDYKDGKVSNPLMATLLKNMTDEDLKTLADEISKFEIEQ